MFGYLHVFIQLVFRIQTILIMNPLVRVSYKSLRTNLQHLDLNLSMSIAKTGTSMAG